MGIDRAQHCKLFTIPAFNKDLLLQLTCLEIPEVWSLNPIIAAECLDGVFCGVVQPVQPSAGLIASCHPAHSGH